MDRRAFISGAAAVLAAPLAAEAQPAAKAARIGFLTGNLAASPHVVEAFRQGLRDLGYVEGRNVVIEYRDAEGKFERLPARAAELVALKVDVIVAGGTPQALAAKQATRTVPIVFAAAGDPVTSGLVTSLARPGGNVTGFTGLGPELVGKGLERLKQAVPGVSRVAVLWQPGGQGEGTDKDILKEADVAARALGVRLQFVEARGPEDFDRAFSDMTRAHAGALTVLVSPMFFGERRRSWTWRSRPGCQRCFHGGSMSMPGALWPMERTLLICFGAPPPTWTRSSRARSPATSPLSGRRSSSW